MFEFQERLNFSHGIELDEGIVAHLLAAIPLALGTRKPTREEDRQGIDLWIDRRGLSPVAVDFKHTSIDPIAKFGRDELAVETWSVVTPTVKKIGWTLDRRKRTDLVVYTWPTETTARRFWIAWFPFICEAARRNYRPRWSAMFKEHRIDNGSWETLCMYVPHEEVERAMREIMVGKARAPRAGKDGA